MNFGCSVNDFVALGILAWKLYKSYKDAPESLRNLSQDLLSFHAVLREAEETIFARSISSSRQRRLKAVHDGCFAVLMDVQGLIEKYENMNTQGKRTWERVKWGTENVTELRARLTSNAAFLNTFYIRQVFPLSVNNPPYDRDD
jgi:hypothetical protein